MTARDLIYGRQGGRIVPFALAEAAGRCDVCRLPTILGQPGRHWTCAAVCPGCHRPTIGRENCQCRKAATRGA